MRRAWTEVDTEALRSWYAEHENKPLNLVVLAVELGRTRSLLCRKARTLGLTVPHRKQGGKKRRAKHPDEATRHATQVRGPITAARRRTLSEAMHARLTSGGNVYSRCKHGRRPDLDNRFFRSRWEANYARYLNLLMARGAIASWEYECETFWFEKIRRGVRSYTPDFRVTANDGSTYFVEVKGWMDAKSKTKIKRMAKYHPTVDLRVVGDKAYYEIEKKLSGAIPNWERAT